MVKIGIDKYVYTNNGSYKLTDEDIETLQKEGTTLSVVQSRVDAGWNMKDAIRLNKRYIKKGEQFKARIRANGKVAFLSEDAISDMRAQGLSFRDLDARLRRGTNLLREPSEEYDAALIRLAKEDREREERKQARLDAKHRKEQERLQMIAKHRVSSKWFEHLSENNKVARLKQDVYGNTQLI